MPGMVTVGGLVINMSADTAQLKTDMAAGMREVDAGAKSMINSMTGVTESSGRVTDAGARMVAQLRQEIATFGMSGEQLAQQKAILAGVGTEYEALTRRLASMKAAQSAFTADVAATSDAMRSHGAAVKEAGAATHSFSLASASARTELLVLAHELSQGNTTRFSQSMMVLGEKTGIASALFSTAGLAVLAMGAAVIGVGTAIAKGAEEQRAMSNALIATGNYAGMTSDSLNGLAHAAVTAGGSIGEAKKTVIELAATGKFTGQQIGLITEAAVAMEHAGGQSIDKTVEAFKSLAVEATGSSMRTSEAISKAAVKLDEEYHFLTEAVYEQIRALEKEGDQKGASALATETLAKVTHDRAEEMKGNIGSIQSAWNGVKEAVGGVVDALGNLGKKTTPQDMIEKYRGILDTMDARPAWISGRDQGGGAQAQFEESRMRIVQALTAAVIAKNNADAAGIKQGKDAAAQQEAVLAASRIEQDNMKLGKKSVTELDDAIQKYGQDLAKIAAANPASKLLDQDAVNEHMAMLRAAHTAKPVKVTGQDDRAGVLQGALTNEQTALERERSIYDARTKMLDTYHSKFGMLDEQYYAGRAAARDEYVAAEKVTFQNESDLLKASEAQARNPQEIAAAKDKYAQLVKTHEKFVDDMRNAGGQDQVGELGAQHTVEEASRDAVNKYTSGLQQQVQAIQAATGARQRSKSAVEQETVALYEQAVANMKLQASAPITEQHTQADHDAAVEMLADLEKQRDAHKDIAEAFAHQESVMASSKAAAQAVQDWQRAGASIADSLSSAFGTAGKAAGDMFKAFADGQAGQLKAQSDLKNAQEKMADGPEKTDAIQRAQLNGAQAQIKSYGDMARAAQGFFKENTTGYKLMEGAERGFRLMELASQMQSLYTHLFVTTTKAAATVSGQTVETGAVATGEAARNTIKIPGVIMSFMSALGPWGAAAAAVAIAAVLGGAFSGGSGAPTAADRQASQGTGGVLGDSSAKSDSIAKSIELSAANSSTQINYLAGMLTSLQAIQTGITSFASQLIQSTDITGQKTALETTGIAAHSNLFDPVANSIPVLGKITEKIATAIHGGKQTLTDSGFTLDPTTLGSAMQSGVQGQSYADITTSGGWFKKDKTSEQATALGEEANRQFTQIISSMSDGIKQAGALLGVTGDDFAKQLNSFVIDIGHVSLKGLSGADAQKALEGVFSKLGDQMAQTAIPELQKFQQVGEGYLQTLVRVAADYKNVDASLESIGKSFGAVGLSSIAAREDLVSLSGGIDKFESSAADFGKNFLTKAQQEAPVAKYVDAQMKDVNGQDFSGVKTRKQFADLVLSLDLTTESGRQTYTSLMGLQSAFAATHAEIVDTSKTVQDIADERKDLQKQYDQATMTSTQLRAKDRAELDASNQSLYDQVQVANTAKDARTLEIQIMGLSGDKIGELAANRAAELAGMDESLRPLKERVYALQDEETALQTSNSLLDILAQTYALTGDKAAAAGVQQQQHAAALLKLDPVLRDATQHLWDLQDAAKEAAIASSRLDVLGQIYALTGNKAGAAAVLEQQHAAALEKLDPALRNVTKTLWDLQAAATQIDGAYSQLQDIVAREKKLLQDKLKLETDVLSALDSIVSATQSTLDSLSGITQADAIASRRAAQDTINADIAIEQAGAALTEAQAEKLQSALAEVTKDASSQFVKYEDYLKDQYLTKISVGKLHDSAKAAQTSLKSTVDADQAQSDSWDKMLEDAKTQIDLLKGINTSSMTIAQGIANLKDALTAFAAAKAAQPPVEAAPAAGAAAAATPGDDPIAQAYQTYLGRAPDAEGKKFWDNAAANGTPMTSIINDIATSTEATLDGLYQSVLHRRPDPEGLAYWMQAYGPKMDASEKADWFKAAQPELGAIANGTQKQFLHDHHVPGFAVGTNYLPSDMLAQVHEGERIIPAADNRELMRRLSSPSDNNAALVAEVRALRVEVAKLREASSRENLAMIKQEQSTTDLLNDVINGARSVQTTVVNVVTTKAAPTTP